MTEIIHPLFDLHGRVALVTGGGSGLGREFCDILAEFGADVVCNAEHQERADATCEIIKKYGHKTLSIGADISQYDQVQSMFKSLEDSFGRLDILVNNAGISIVSSPLDEINVNDWHRVINVDLNGTFYCLREGLKVMLKQKNGSIINIASILGVNAGYSDISKAGAYVAAKSGVIGLTKQAASEYGEYGIRANCIAPGWHLETRLAERAGKKWTEEGMKEFKEIVSSRTPLKRTGETREIKGLLLYLASDASSFVTGQTIMHDGGWTIW